MYKKQVRFALHVPYIRVQSGKRDRSREFNVIRRVSQKEDSTKSNDNGIARIVQRNIRELYEHREAHKQKLTAYEQIAFRIAAACGKPWFVLGNAAFFALWILLNSGLSGIKPFDPFPYGLLTTIVSLEAIFLSLFVLLSQNRMQALADQQSELDLQVNLLTEHEITQVLVAVDLIAKKLEVELPDEDKMQELKAEVAPQELLSEIERSQEE